MRLGIDLGTTRTVVAHVDRGNYPVVSFEDERGHPTEHFPTVVAAHQGGLCYGFEALAAAAQGAPLLRSFKRALASPAVSAATPLVIGDEQHPLLEVLEGFVRALKEALLTRSNLPAGGKQKDPVRELAAVVAVPAHAHAAQRFLTMEAFRRAGIEVSALLNEPSAAGLEYTHRLSRTLTGRRSAIVVYDLGGGTFDASLVKAWGQHHEILATAGDSHLGGDDFDAALAACALLARGQGEALEERGRQALLLACREAKEGIGPNKRRIVLEEPVAATVSIDDFYAAVTPLVERTLAVMAPLVGRLNDDEAAGAERLDGVAGVYLVGGGSGLPLIARVLKERFGRRVHRSPYPSASIAIGLAIAADERSGFTLQDRFSRSFGVFREGAGGAALSFDPIVETGAALPQERSVVVRRRYRAAHNLGHYRFVECASLGAETLSDFVPFGEVLFPFDSALREASDLRAVAVERTGPGPLIEERYVLAPSGLVEVELEDLDDGFARTFRLGVNGVEAAAAPKKPRKKAKA
jgi:molecular chaperone DnaK (HSP70)